MQERATVGRGAATRQRRADAERSIEAILDATLKETPANGELNMSAIARAAGVSRVTLYTHFPTREALVDAALQRGFAQTQQALSELALEDGPPRQVLAQLLRSSWQVVERHRNLYMVASANLPPAQLRAYAEPVLGRVERLLARGRSEGEFRADLPLDWLVATVYTLMHLGAQQVATGRASADRAGELVSLTIMTLLTSPPGCGRIEPQASL
ncbi:TetR/AcrR family transcriptional regulator [Actinocrinis puniceicyclus]|uniref:TetR/AcrR family transcriptional regulator n=1 Tax=Actinocrinis puniceicyclus TaxID=977794 RepID=A0A8J7WUM2_9ACTN|nr:TetR/AcrR family transcriptional regulator [Actinocrinis puniceicyclus]MBS2965449.1 TetR/AcrR family transcriptional regulator [Actinocrinis puniceicyclus]